jgi:hypothetical protein
MRKLTWLLLWALCVGGFRPTLAQNAPCGIVDQFDYPVQESLEVANAYDDFGIYRARFGGLHTGYDMAFDRWGDPVVAVARGQVTYSDIEGWDTEKGVVIIQHVLPDSSYIYSVYGHVEQTDSIRLPSVGTCVELGQVIGAVGWPSRGRPHLHYELRTFNPNDGGPGYVSQNPLEQGWLHPIDYTQLWQARNTPGFMGSVTFDQAPSQAPILLENGTFVMSSGATIEAVIPPNITAWRMQADSPIVGLGALSQNRVVARALDGTVVVTAEARYLAAWRVAGPDVPLVVLNDVIAIVAEGGAIVAYDPTGAALWTATPFAGEHVQMLGDGAGQLLQINRVGATYAWRVVSLSDGSVLAGGVSEGVATGISGGAGAWTLFTAGESSGGELVRVVDGAVSSMAVDSVPPGRFARLTVDTEGGVYVFLDDAQNTLLALNADGGVRWQQPYPFPTANALSPYLQADSCLLFTMDTNGVLSAFALSDGALSSQMRIYAGGTLTASPRGRLLRMDQFGRLQAGAGFLTMVVLDSRTWCLG